MARRQTTKPPMRRNTVAKSGAGGAISRQAKNRLASMGGTASVRREAEALPEGLKRGVRKNKGRY